MDYINMMKDLSEKSPSKIIMLVIDGLGGIPGPDTGLTELETAHTPNMDHLVTKSICGLTDPVAPGITPGSGAGHMALFGYDSVSYDIGRGVLEAMGIDFDLQPGDVAARGNFCTVDDKGKITDRRAGRISTEKCAELTALLNGTMIGSIKVLVSPVKEHRFVAVFRGAGLVPKLTESDPQQTGVPAKEIQPLSPEAASTAHIVNQFISRAKEILASHHPANMILLRGFSQNPHLPSFQEIYKLTPAAIAVYPMYRGLAKLVGMDILKTGTTIEDEFATIKENYAKYDFFFVHVKWADSAGEDGDFDRKVRVIEQIDDALPEIINLDPDVIVLCGDHSTPAVLKAHSWHPVPTVIYSRWCRPDSVREFSESACRRGGIGRIPATSLMPMVMANALKLTKFGA